MTETYQVNLTQQAQNDLEQIFYYIADDSIGKAENFILQLEEKIYSLEVFPHRNALISENEFFGTDYRHLIYKKYRIIYRIVQKSVWVLACPG
ncbi:MAG: type II toxin-antitoxin system RelE/ParE family toxin [Thermodesulfobacteriota bacterium]|nr:type II toxin-antitoxin system RelE/ParE family toxin [Thermodesulfobacteriota bacterium]